MQLKDCLIWCAMFYSSYRSFLVGIPVLGLHYIAEEQVCIFSGKPGDHYACSSSVNLVVSILCLYILRSQPSGQYTLLVYSQESA